jgi:hypothetical protein
MQAKAKEIGGTRFDLWRIDVWDTYLASGFEGKLTYRLRPDYTEEPKWSERVFASTTDSEKDSMNNTVGVTAHCMCGNVFCDDVVHGKPQAKPETEEPEIEKLVLPAILKKLEEIRCGLIDIEMAIHEK